MEEVGGRAQVAGKIQIGADRFERRRVPRYPYLRISPSMAVFKTPRQNIFRLEALGAAYTPLAIGEDGKEHSQNEGHLFVVGK